MLVLLMVCMMDTGFAEFLKNLLGHASPLAELLIPLLTCMLLTSVFKSVYASDSNAGGAQMIRATIVALGRSIGEALMKVELFIERPMVKMFRKLRKFFNKVLPRSVSELLAIFLISIILTVII